MRRRALHFGKPAKGGEAWLDIEGVLARRWGRLDLALFRHEVVPLLELRGDPEILVRFDRLYTKLQRRLG